MISRMTVWVLICLCAGCVTQSPMSYQSPYPPASYTAASAVLEKDAIRNLTAYLKKQYDCDDFEILKREIIRKSGDVYLDGKGRLVSGQVRERWTLRQCGEVKTHEFLMAPDGKRGNFMAFGELQLP